MFLDKIHAIAFETFHTKPHGGIGRKVSKIHPSGTSLKHFMTIHLIVVKIVQSSLATD